MSRLTDWLDRTVTYNPAKQEQHNRALGMDWYQSQLQAYYNGTAVIPGPRMSWDTKREEPITGEYDSLVARAYRRNGIVFAAVLARALVFSEVRFKYRTLSDKKLFGTASLSKLENPGQNVTTGELLFRMEQDVSLAGNWFGTDRYGGISRLRPDWVSLILSSSVRPEDPSFAEDAQVVGYYYRPPEKPEGTVFGVDEVAHWSPIPDPWFQFRGMSWIEVVAREVMADNSGTDLRLRFYENGATPNMVVEAPEWVKNQDQFDEYREKMDAESAGVSNAFKTLYLTSGSSATKVGLGLAELDFKAIQGSGETRIALASRVPSVLLQNSEGLSGSSLNAGNFSSARRQFADMFMRPQWRSACACLSKFAAVPVGSELWFDESAVSFLREDEKDAAEIMGMKAGALRQLVEGGFDPATAIAAVNANDIQLLSHTGLLSVQLQEPGAQGAPPPDATTEEGDQP